MLLIYVAFYCQQSTLIIDKLIQPQLLFDLTWIFVSFASNILCNIAKMLNLLK